MSPMKEHLKTVVRSLLDDGFEPDELTVRQIAHEAHVATGIINYHYGSKKNLIVEVVSSIIEEATLAYFHANAQLDDSPKEQLSQFLKAMVQVVAKYKAYSRFIIEEEFIGCSYDTPHTIHDLLKAVKPEMSNMEIRLLAIQIVAPMQYMFLKEDGLKGYLYGDCSDENRTHAIDYEVILDRILGNLGL